MKQFIFLLSLSMVPFTGFSQNFWNETFTNGCAAGCNASGYAGANGAWAVTNTGVNGADNNQFYISCAENGQNAGVCGAGCGADASLHIGSNNSVLGDNGAAYLAGGLGFWFIETNLRAESPIINCTGRSNITVCFNYIEWGDAALDDATLWYFDGVTWSQINVLPKTNCCGNIPCNGALQGLWVPFNAVLPASANNNPNVRIGFNWTNNDDNVGTDPSFAVDDVILSTVPGSSPIAGLAAVNCNDAGIVYSVTNNPGDTYNWTLSGGGVIASGQGTNSITINWGGAPGNYILTLTETSCAGIGTPVTLNVNVNCGGGTPPNSAFTISNDTICAGTCIDFVDASTGSPTSWSWTFAGGTPANSVTQNQAGVCFNVAGSYNVTLTATNGNGNSTSTQTVVVNSVPVVNINPVNPTICNNDTVNLVAAGATSYTWAPPVGLSATNIDNPDAFPAATQTYTVTGTSNGCSATASATVTVATGITANILAAPPAVCPGGNTQLTASGGTGYAWTADPTLSCTNCVNPIATPTVNTVYEVIVTSGSCTPDTATINININPQPNASVTPANDTVCLGGNTVLTAAGGVTYLWSPAVGLSATNTAIVTATPAAPTTYQIIVTDNNNCTDTAFANLNLYPQPTAQFVGDVLAGCTPLCVNFTDQSNVAGSTITSWSWNVEGQAPSANQNVNYCFGTVGLFDAALTVTTADGCTNTTTLTDYINTNSTINAGFNFTPVNLIYFVGQDITMNNTSTGATNYQWIFGATDSSILTNPVYTPADTGTVCITLVASDAGGCLDSATTCIYVQSEFSLFYPNTFTPNLDEINPVFHIYGQGIKTLDVKIYDRWGEEIFTISSLAQGWNGNRLNGVVCPQGVYVCKIFATDFGNNEYSYINHLNLIR
jgi:gliding motility-associated-like protein